MRGGLSSMGVSHMLNEDSDQDFSHPVDLDYDGHVVIRLWSETN